MPRHLLSAIGAVLLLVIGARTQAQTAAAVAPAAASAKVTVAPAAATTSAPATASNGDASEDKVAYYGHKFAGRKTASGERFNPGALTMAHKTLPFGTLVRVTNLKNSTSLVVRVNDRSPMTADRVADLSQAAAGKIGMLQSGVIDAKLQVVGKATMRSGKHHAGTARKAHKKA